MVSFYEFLTEAVAKKSAFRSTVKDIYSSASLVKGFDVSQKIVFTIMNKKEYAKFELIKKDYPQFNGLISNDEGVATWRRETKDIIKKNIDGMLSVLGCPKAAKSNLKSISTSFFEEEMEIKFKGEKDYEWNIRFTIQTSRYGSASLIMDVEVYGDTANVEGEEVFEEYPKMIPGTILRCTFGYSMTINHYYIIESRSKKTIFCREIGSKVIEGQHGYHGKEVPDATKRGSKLFKCILRNERSVKVNNETCYIWDGTANYFNQID